jgi:hypothetical protein
MPDPERLLRTLHRAVQAVDATPGRKGRTIDLQHVVEVLAAGDLHGNVDNFSRLLAKAELARNPGRHLVVQELIHGDFLYPDGSDRSHQLIDLFSALKCQFPNQVHFLLGNHELAEWQGEWIAKGERDLSPSFYAGIEQAYGARAAEVYETYRKLFARTPVAIRTPNRVYLSHSTPSARRLGHFDRTVLETDDAHPSQFKPGGAIHALVWGRDISEENVRAFLQAVDADFVITGHIPCPQGFDAPNPYQLILDSTGAPAAYCLFPTDRPLTQGELMSCVHII